MTEAAEGDGSEPAARTVDATKIYRSGSTRTVALDSVSVSFESRRFTAVMGPSGSGKSTLLHCVAGLDTLTSGQTFIGRTDLTKLSDRNVTLLRRETLGFVFQTYNLIGHLTARENIELPLSLAHEHPDGRWMTRVIKTLGLTKRLEHKPSQLSGGQQQRVAIARALATRPQIVLADEPTGNLDSKASREVLQLLRQSVDELGQTVVMVTHDAGAAAYADRVVYLADGSIAGEATDPTAASIIDRLADLGAR